MFFASAAGGLVFETCSGQVMAGCAEQVQVLLASGPGQPGYDAALLLAGSIDRDAKEFWAGEW